MVNTGEPARDGKESGKEAGETRTEISEALQAVKLAIVTNGVSPLHTRQVY